MTIHICLHVDVEDETAAIEISEQLSRQATGFALAGHDAMMTIDNKTDAAWLGKTP